MGTANQAETRGSAYEQLEHEFAVLMRRARGASGALARDVHPDLDAAAYGLLARIEEGGTVRVTDLADFFGVGKPTVSRQIALLESLSLVVRKHNEGDARSRFLALTEAGRAMLSAARVARLERIRTQLQAWAADDVERFAGLLHRYNQLS